MGNYKARRQGFMQVWEIEACKRTFRGESDDKIIKELFGVTDKDDIKAIRNAKQRLQRLRKTERFIEYYKSIVTEFHVHNYGKAIHKLSEQIDSENEWLANKAANDVIAQCKKAAIGEDENTVTIKFEGMPELGRPDQEEEDADGND